MPINKYHKLNSFFIIFTIVQLVVLSQFNETMYATILEIISKNFNLYPEQIKNTLISYFIGFAIGTILFGYIADIIGSKITIIIGTIIYIISTLICYLLDSFYGFIILRFIQAIGCSSLSIVAQTIIKTNFTEKKRYNIFNINNIIISFVPSLGLIIGIYIVEHYYWKNIFLLLFVWGIVILSLIILFIPNDKTFSKKNLYKIFNKECLNLYSLMFTKVINNLNTLRLGAIIGITLALLFSCYSQINYYLIHNFNCKTHTLYINSIAISIALLMGSLVSMKMQITSKSKIFLGVNLVLCSSGIFFFSVMNLTNKNLILPIFFLSIYILLMGVSLIIPNSLYLILKDYSKNIGTLASILGFYYYGITAVCTFFLKIINIEPNINFPLYLILSSLVLYMLSSKALKQQK